MFAELPWWISHGYVVWLSVTLLAALGGAWLARRWERSAARAEARAALEYMGEAEPSFGARTSQDPEDPDSDDAADDGDGSTVAGVLVASGPTGELPRASIVVSSHLDLDLDDVEVAIDVQGARVAVPRATVKVGSHEHWQDDEWVRHLAVGDRVRAYGLLKRAHGGYRDRAGFLLTEIPEDEATDREEDDDEVTYAPMVFEGTPLRRPRPKRLALGAGIAAIISLALTWLVGNLSHDLGTGLALRAESYTSSVTLLAAITAATPFHAEEGRQLALASWHPRRQPNQLGRFIALEREIKGGCEVSAAWVLENRSLAEYVELARLCDDDSTSRAAARVAFFAGELDAARELAGMAPASSRLDERLLDALIAVASGDSKAIVDSAGRVADAERGHNSQTRLEPHSLWALRCIQMWARASDPDQLAELGRLAVEHAQCRLLWLDRAPKARAQRLLQEQPRLAIRLGALYSALVLERDIAVDTAMVAPVALPGDLPAGRTSLPVRGLGVWLTAVRARRQAAEQRGRLALNAAQALAVMGADGKARELLQIAAGELGGEHRSGFAQAPSEVWDVAFAATPRSTLEIESFDATTPAWQPAPSRELAALLGYVTKGSTAGLSALGQRDDFGLEGLELATRDGAALAEWLDRHPAHASMSVLALGARHVKRGRAELLRWVRRVPPGRRCEHVRGCRLELVVADQHTRAVAAKLLGDAALASRLEASARKLRALLTRRDVAVPLAVLLTL